MRPETDAATDQALEMGSVAIDAAIAEITRLRAALDAMTKERDAARAKALEDALAAVRVIREYHEANQAKGGPGHYIEERMAAAVGAAENAIRAMKEPKK